MAKARFQFSLRFVLLWVIPWAAAIAMTWDLSESTRPDQDYLFARFARFMLVFFALAFLWGIILLIVWTTKEQGERP
jgi:hypothetical protein